jgi:4-oxalocrotonate tautomerase
MPLVQVTLLEGRSPERKERLIAELTDAVVRAVESPRENVRVVLYEVPDADWGTGGVSKRRQAEQEAGR